MWKATLTLAILGFGGLFAAPSVAQQAPDGFIHGTVETRGGTTYTGTIRWDDEETFWDDLFNSGKDDNTYARHVPRDDRRRGRAIKVFGFTIGYDWDDVDFGHQFVARFGDIERLEIRGRRSVDVVMKSGERYPVEGLSNDIGTDIVVFDDSLGEVELDWDRIDRITFSPTPSGTRPQADRLWGKVETDVGRFEGFVQWDSEECLSTDELDGETRDGDMSIQMGKIAAIEKRNRNGAWVELKDGRRILLEDTNDVDHSINGIFVEDERYGRVKIGWDSFDRVDFEAVDHTGLGYGDYEPAKPLRGTVETRDGETLRGRIVFDLDEAETWEFLNGRRYDVEYYIPFAMVRSVTPTGDRGATVVLVDGTALELEDSNDVDEDNDGLLVFMDDDDPEYVGWHRVEQIRFD